jgi:uncharacterized protein (TIGR00369 family)
MNFAEDRVGLSVEQQRTRRDWFRSHWQNGVAFNRFCNMAVRQWDDGGAQVHLPFAEHLSSHPGIFHGGVVSALLDTTATGAVICGHDFALGSRLTTISLTVQFVGSAPGEDLLASGECIRRGRSVNFAQARVVGTESGKLVATAQVVANIAGERPGAPWADIERMAK